MVEIFFLFYFVRNTVGECKQSKELPENNDISLYVVKVKSLVRSNSYLRFRRLYVEKETYYVKKEVLLIIKPRIIKRVLLESNQLSLFCRQMINQNIEVTLLDRFGKYNFICSFSVHHIHPIILSWHLRIIIPWMSSHT